VDWLANSGLSIDDPDTDHAGLREVEYHSFARVLNAQGRHAEALSLLKRLLKAAEAEERFGSVIAILNMQTFLFHKQASMANAQECLEQALILAEPEGYERTFVDEGSSMRLLLADFYSRLKQRMSISLTKSHSASRRIPKNCWPLSLNLRMVRNRSRNSSLSL
jgi:LuxR family maltose regulon positive regulatory protein